MSINLTPILQAVITLAAALITYRLIPWLKEKLGAEKQAQFDALLRTLVFAAEQMFGAGNGEEKLHFVCDELRDRGYEVDLPQIEATVYGLLNRNVLKITEESFESAQAETPVQNNAPPTDAAESRE